MTSCEAEGFITGYRNKEAGAGSAVATGLSGGFKFTGELIGQLLPYFLLLPIAVGGGAGLIHSKLTSPSKLDISGAQKQLELSELEEFATELKRRREAGTRQGKKEKSDARTLRL